MQVRNNNNLKKPNRKCTVNTNVVVEDHTVHIQPSALIAKPNIIIKLCQEPKYLHRTKPKGADHPMISKKYQNHKSNKKFHSKALRLLNTVCLTYSRSSKEEF